MYHTASPPRAKTKPITEREGGNRAVDRLPRLAEVAAGAAEAVDLALFLGEGLHHADAGQHARQPAGLLAHGVPIVVVAGLQVAGEVPTAGHDQRHGQQRHDRQLGIQVEEHHADARQLQRLQQQPAGDVVDERVQRFGVVGHAAHQHADLVAVVKGQAAGS